MWEKEHYDIVRNEMKKLEFLAGRSWGRATIWNEFGDARPHEDYELHVRFRMSGLHFEEILVSPSQSVELSVSIWSYDLSKQQFVRWRFGSYSTEPRASSGQFEGNRLIMTENVPYRPWQESYEQGDCGGFIWSTYTPRRAGEGYYKGREVLFQSQASTAE